MQNSNTLIRPARWNPDAFSENLNLDRCRRASCQRGPAKKTPADRKDRPALSVSPALPVRFWSIAEAELRLDAVGAWERQ
jgi:hypothetical protein